MRECLKVDFILISASLCYKFAIGIIFVVFVFSNRLSRSAIIDADFAVCLLSFLFNSIPNDIEPGSKLRFPLIMFNCYPSLYWPYYLVPALWEEVREDREALSCHVLDMHTSFSQKQL